jgi:hypothetical protein
LNSQGSTPGSQKSASVTAPAGAASRRRLRMARDLAKGIEYLSGWGGADGRHGRHTTKSLGNVPAFAPAVNPET